MKLLVVDDGGGCTALTAALRTLDREVTVFNHHSRKPPKGWNHTRHQGKKERERRSKQDIRRTSGTDSD